MPPKGNSGVEATMALTKTCRRRAPRTALRLGLVVGPDAEPSPKRCVGHGEGLVDVGDPLDHGHRPEHLLCGHPHLGGDPVSTVGG